MDADVIHVVFGLFNKSVLDFYRRIYFIGYIDTDTYTFFIMPVLYLDVFA